MAEILKPIGDKSLAEQAYQAIREAILKTDLAPGQALSEAQLATALSTSKTPIREALQRLQQAGLIVAAPHKGYFVAELTLRDALEIVQIRSRIEGLAAFESCNRLTDADLRRMELLIEEAQAAFDAGQQDICAELGHQFHQVMIDRSGNSRIVSFMSILSDQFHRLRLLLSDWLPGRLQTSMDEHRQILAALRSRDPNRAEDSMRDHLVAVYRDLEEATALPRCVASKSGEGRT